MYVNYVQKNVLQPLAHKQQSNTFLCCMYRYMAYLHVLHHCIIINIVFRLDWISWAAADRNMNWVLLISAVIFHVHVVIEAYTSDVTLVQTTQVIDGLKNFKTLGGSVQESTAVSDDVRCTNIDGVAAARRLLCPAHCSCSPLAGQEVLTQLIVDCSGTKFNDSTSTRLKLLSRCLDQLLSRCVSNLTELNITNTLLTTVPQVICQLTKIQSLNLNSNRLASLSGNCFTHMVNLTSFTANNNRLTSLQVRWQSTKIVRVYALKSLAAFYYHKLTCDVVFNNSVCLFIFCSVPVLCLNEYRYRHTFWILICASF